MGDHPRPWSRGPRLQPGREQSEGIKHLGEPVKEGDLLALVEAAAVGQAKAEYLQALTQLDA